jgi:hypothetical protein
LRCFFFAIRLRRFLMTEPTWCSRRRLEVISSNVTPGTLS